MEFPNHTSVNIRNLSHPELLELENEYINGTVVDLVNLVEISEYFCDILHLRKYEHRQNRITRSHYDFCKYGAECKGFYDNSECSSDHYPYDKIRADLMSVIKYFDDPDNVKKSLNTLRFVICHMKFELEEYFKKLQFEFVE